MKILMFGLTGQLACEIMRRKGSHHIEAHGRNSADLMDPDACTSLIATTNADAIINAAAFTAVDRAETDTRTAHQVNSVTPSLMAQAAAARNIPFVHVSTDYVFDGSGQTAFTPEDKTAPLGVYGQTKLEGERAIISAGGPHAILRTSWVISSHGQNFVKTMLRLGAERPRLTVVADQIGGPTPAATLADACMTVAKALCTAPEKSGVYHFAGAPHVSWADLAREIMTQAGFVSDVVDVSSSEYPTAAKRPLNSRLDTSSFEKTFGMPRPDWRQGLSDILTDLEITCFSPDQG